MLRFVIQTIFLFPFLVAAQIKEPYALFDDRGKKISYEKFIQSGAKADIIFFGELHDNTLAHWLELQVLKDMYQYNRNIIVGMEMFETDDQLIINEYMNGVIGEKHLTSEAKVWDNYITDYRPIVEFSKANKLRLIATNVPRRYANLVYRKGISALDSLAAEAKSMIPPLPFEVDYSQPNYKSMMEGMSQHGKGSAENFVAAQALKDATMAHNISRHHVKGQLFYHINGAYHSQDHQGIVSCLGKMRQDMKILTIHVVEQEDITGLDKTNTHKADFTFCIVDDMIKSQ